MVTFRQDFLPEELDKAEWKKLIETAIAEAPNRLHVTINDVMGIEQIILEGCTYPDGTPVWDAPLVGHSGVVAAYFRDGRVEKLTTEDGHGWEVLIDWLEALTHGWGSRVAETLSYLADAETRVRKLEKQLREIKGERVDYARQARDLGVSDYRMAQIAGRAKTTIASWLK